MTPSSSFRVILLLAAAGALAYTASLSRPARAAASPLLNAVSADDAAGVQVPDDPTVKRSRLTTINFDVLPGPTDRRMLREPTITLELFPDVTIFAAFDRYDPNRDGVTWVGHVEDVPMSTVTLVYSGGEMAGSIVTPTALYQIRPAPQGAAAGSGRLHVVSQIDQDRFMREADPIEPVLNDAELAASDTPMTDPADVIDVMVVYTAAAAAHAGGRGSITNLINLAVSETNTSYANSGVEQRIRLVHAAQVDYVESGDFGTNLTNLRTGAGALSGVAAQRDAHGADLVKMLVRPAAANACGIAYLMTSVTSNFAPFGYSVTDTSCVSPNYTFAHELGHNMGARHDWFVDGGTTPFTYAHGHVNATPGQRWRTIMAYADQCSRQGFSCTRLLNWANPDKRYNAFCERGFDCSRLQYWFFPGSPMGIPGGSRTNCQPGNMANTDCDADDRRTLNQTALAVANFRQAGQREDR